ncbi:hypothetical protein HCN44_008923 [Aphidius gifuensis]|uniref:Alpha-and gamma-adaptin-binding protein p34 n=1 Tax=Aphidius gifuensis TaxID=684658 RepID=A0A834XTX4_APHGI|nr:alpha- and gamma-adaptin-binding protein p34-like [Aphidius gifuensis]KAF7991552.1 hypothetical protein HCN44_008923 [Aphidius gifuensis]
MDLPRVLVLSSNIEKITKIAKDLDSKFVAESNNVKFYTWDIINKYYNAKVMLCVTDNITPEISIDNIEAVLLHYDPTIDESQTISLDNYLPFIKTLTEADVFLLACDKFPDSTKRDEVSEWCHVNNFELVDMEASESSDNDNDDDIIEGEKYGLERIIEVLHTHTWPNRSLKGIPHGRISTSNEPDVSQVEDQLENIRLIPTGDPSQHMLMNSVLDGIMGDENADFGELFGQLMAMKQHATTLTSSNRRAAAEQLVTAFWRSIGGDPSELEDMDE